MTSYQRVTSYIIHGLLVKWNRLGYSAMSINTGNCDEFAADLEQRFPEGRAVWGDEIPKAFKGRGDHSGHCFFKFKSRYYDSEAPLGVKRPDDLPYYIRARKHILG